MHTTMSLHGYLRSTRGIKRHTYSVANGTCFRVTYKRTKQRQQNFYTQPMISVQCSLLLLVTAITTLLDAMALAKIGNMTFQRLRSAINCAASPNKEKFWLVSDRLVRSPLRTTPGDFSRPAVSSLHYDTFHTTMHITGWVGASEHVQHRPVISHVGGVRTFLHSACNEEFQNAYFLCAPPSAYAGPGLSLISGPLHICPKGSSE